MRTLMALSALLLVAACDDDRKILAKMGGEISSVTVVKVADLPNGFSYWRICANGMTRGGGAYECHFITTWAWN